MKMSLNLITQVCVFVIITVGVNDAEREGHCSGVAGGTEDMYLPSPETLIKQQQRSHHITSLPGSTEGYISCLFIFHCMHMQAFDSQGSKADALIVLSKR